MNVLIVNGYFKTHSEPIQHPSLKCTLCVTIDYCLIMFLNRRLPLCRDISIDSVIFALNRTLLFNCTTEKQIIECEKDFNPFPVKI